jgi:preprotein translocase subunit SecA
MRELERRVLLSVLDRKWREHLYEMDYLREGIYLRAYSQRDPLVEYQREGFEMFSAMMDSIKEEAVGFLFNLEVQVEEEEFHYHPDGTRHAGPMHEGALAEPPVSVGVEGVSLEAIGEALKAASPQIRAKGLGAPSAPQHLSYSAPDEQGGQAVKAAPAAQADDPYTGVGRNEQCPCGSGKKFKQCHGRPGGPTGLTTRVNG